MDITMKIDMMKTLKELGKLHKEIQKLKTQEFVELQIKIENLEKQLKQNTIEAAASINVENWMPDRFSKGKKDMVLDGTNVILRSKRTVRTIKTGMFLDLYPLMANVMIEHGDIKIPVGIIEKELGEKRTNDICEANVRYSYEFQSRAYEPLAKDVEETKDEQITTKTKKNRSKRKIKVDA